MKNIYQVIKEKITSFIWLKAYVNYLFYSLFLLIPISIILILLKENSVDFQVKSVSPKAEIVMQNSGFKLQNTGLQNLIIEKVNFIEKIIYSSYQSPITDLVNCIYLILVLGQLKNMFKRIDLNKPFQFPLYKTLKNISLITLVFLLIEIGKNIYASEWVKKATYNEYVLVNSNFYFLSISLRACLFLFFMAFILKKGAALQQEQNLTI